MLPPVGGAKKGAKKTLKLGETMRVVEIEKIPADLIDEAMNRGLTAEQFAEIAKEGHSRETLWTILKGFPRIAPAPVAEEAISPAGWRAPEPQPSIEDVAAYENQQREGEPAKPAKRKEAKAKIKTKTKAKGGVTTGVAKNPKPVRPDGSKTKKEQMLDMVCRPEGATEAEICEAIGGWKKCRTTLYRSAAASNVALRAEKVAGAKQRYFNARRRVIEAVAHCRSLARASGKAERRSRLFEPREAISKKDNPL